MTVIRQRLVVAIGLFALIAAGASVATLLKTEPVTECRVHEAEADELPSEWAGDWHRGHQAEYSGGARVETAAPGATVAVHFDGSSITWLRARAFNRGIVAAQIDGGAAQHIDSYVAGIEYQQPARFEGLAPGQHVLRLTLLADKHPDAQYSSIDVDAFEVCVTRNVARWQFAAGTVQEALLPLASIGRVAGLLLAAAAALAFLSVILVRALEWSSRIPLSVMVGLVILAAGAVRLPYAVSLPLTNDEGAYLQDAVQINGGALPYRDFLTKSPTLLYLLAGIVQVAGNDMFAGRGLSIAAALGTALLLYFIGERIFEPSVGIVAAAVFALSSTTVALTTYGQSQGLQQLLVVLALFLLLEAGARRSYRRFVLSGILFAAAFFARQTTLALGLVAGVLILMYMKDWQQRVLALTAILVGFAGVAVPIIALSLEQLGLWKTFDLLGLEMLRQILGRSAAAVGSTSVGSSVLRDLSLEGSLLFGAGLNVTVLAMTFLIVGICCLFVRQRLVAPVAVTAVLGWTVILPDLSAAAPLVGSGQWLFGDLRGSPTGMYEIARLGAVTLAIVVSATLDRPGSIVQVRDGSPQQPSMMLPMAFVCSWLAALAITYGVWIKFRTPYIIEFLPVMSLAAAVVLVWAWRALHTARRPGSLAARAVFLIALLASTLAGHYLTFTHPVMGDLPLGTARSVSAYLRANVPPDQPVFTAKAMIPYLSGHRLPYNVSHPSWYASNQVTEEMLIQYFPPISELEAYAASRLNWAVLDPFTEDVYFRASPQLQAIFRTRFEVTYQQDGVRIVRRKAE